MTLKCFSNFFHSFSESITINEIFIYYTYIYIHIYIYIKKEICLVKNKENVMFFIRQMSQDIIQLKTCRTAKKLALLSF